MEEGKKRGGGRKREERKKEQMEKIKNVQVPESERLLSYWRFLLSYQRRKKNQKIYQNMRNQREEEDEDEEDKKRKKRPRRRKDILSSRTNEGNMCELDQARTKTHLCSTTLSFYTGNLLHVGGVFTRRRFHTLVTPLACRS